VFSEEEYLAMSAVAAERHEYVDGQVLDMAGGDADHAIVIANVVLLLGNALRGGPGRCRPYTSDLRVWAPVVRSWVYPDVTVVCGPVERSRRPGDRISITNPVVVVEVVSPGSESYDREDKLRIYRAVHTVRDYVVIDPKDRTIEHWSRMDGDEWDHRVVLDGAVTLTGVPATLPHAGVFEDLDLAGSDA
jgi:Uma2 family endonuclease